MNAHVGKNPARGKRVEVERTAIAAIPGERVTLEATLVDARVLTLDMTRAELAELVVRGQAALGDRRLEEATARIAAIEAEQRELAGAIDRLCESRGQGSADDQGGPLAAVRHLVDYIAGEEREAEKVEVERDDLRSQADDAHEALSAAGVAAGELPERVEDVIEERDRLDQVPDLLAEVRRLLQRLDAGGVPASRSTPKRAARPRAPPERKPRP